jgi:hypothetical protein
MRKFTWDKVMGYAQGCNYLDYELTIFQIEDDDFKWFIDSKKGESIANGYGLTVNIAKKIAEITLLQILEKEETDYEQTTYDDSYDNGADVDDCYDAGYDGMWGFI